VLARVFEYVVSGGDILSEFVAAATENNERPAVTFRINDFQSCAEAPTNNYGALSQFWYEHKSDPSAIQSPKGFNATCCWEKKCAAGQSCDCYDGSASMVLSDPGVLANRRSLMLEIIGM
jgi:hypothetical protein